MGGLALVEFREATEQVARIGTKSVGIDEDMAIEHATGKALHLGTYEAGVENMLRRRRDQADGAAQF